jgi:hypothetical protein
VIVTLLMFEAPKVTHSFFLEFRASILSGGTAALAPASREKP